jgi:four helix bundle protein
MGGEESGDIIMEKAKIFEDLWIWQQSRELVKDIYSDFGKGTRGSRDFSFRNQIQKAGISIMNNIAEGFERKSDVEFARFLEISKGSCAEVRSMYYPAQDLDYVTEQVSMERREKVKQIAAGISSLAFHLRKQNIE